MKKIFMMPVLAAVLGATACGDSDPTNVETDAQVRFFNVAWNASSNIGFTANGQFATGSAIAYAQSSQTCTRLDAGNTSFGIGLANAGGTALSGSTIATLDNQTLAAGGNYTVLAGGNVIHPSVVLLDNNFSGSLGANQAAVRFVNLAASAEFPFTVSKGTGGSATVVQSNIGFRAATPFSSVTSGSNAYTIMYGQDVAISGSEGTLNLQGGTVTTIVIVRNPLTGNFNLVAVPSC